MKANSKKIAKILIAGFLTLAMVIQIFGGLSSISMATDSTDAQSDTSAPATLKGSTLTLDGSLKTNVVAELSKAARGETELTFSDFTEGSTANIMECSAGYTSWDGLTLTGYITFGEGYLLLGCPESAKWQSIQINAIDTGLQFNCCLNPDYATFLVDGSSELPIITDDEADVDFQTDRIKLGFTFDYTDTGMYLGVEVNNKLIRRLDIGTVTYNETTYNIKDYLCMNLAFSGGIEKESEVDYQEVTFSDFVEGATTGIMECSAGYSTWDGLKLTGYITFDSSYLLLGAAKDAKWQSIAISANDEGGLFFNCCANPVYAGYMEETITSTEAGVNFKTDRIKLGLSFDYTDSGIDLGVEVNDILIRTLNIGTVTYNDTTYNIKEHLYMNLAFSGNLTVESIEKTAVYEELTFSDFGISDGIMTTNQLYNCTKLDSWDGVALTGYIKSSGTSTNWLMFGDTSLAWNGIRLYPDADGGLRIDYSGENQVKISAGGVNFWEDLVRLRLTFDYTTTGIDMGVYANGMFVDTISIAATELAMCISAQSVAPIVNSINLAVADGGYMTFAMPSGDIQTVEVKDATLASEYGDSHYIFTFDVAAKEMADNVGVQFHCGDWSSETEQYSVKAYADTIIANADGAYDAKTVALAEKLLDYGATSQNYFNYNTGSLANPEFTGNNLKVTSDMLQTYAKDVQTHDQIATLTSTNLILESETTLKMYFTFASGVSRDDFTFTDEEGNTLEAVQSGNRYCVVFENIKAHELDKDYIVTITSTSDNSVTYTYSYSALSYCYVALTYSQASTNLKNLAKALYLYNQAAETYILEVNSVTGYALELDAGTWDSPHVQGIAKDDENNYMYFSFTDRLVKVDMKTGQTVASVKLFGSAHLGDITYYDGCVYGSFNRDYYSTGTVENKYHVAVFDTSKMIGIDMGYQDVMKTMSISAVNDQSGGVFEPTAFDGITFGPKPGDTSGKTYLMLAAYLDNSDQTHQAIMAFDPDNFNPNEVTSTSNLSTEGPELADIFYLNAGPLTGESAYGAQVLEYDKDAEEYWLCCYPQFKAGNLFVVDATVVTEDSKTLGEETQTVNVLTLKQIGTQCADDETVWGIYPYTNNTAQGFISMGNDYFYIESGELFEDRLNRGSATLYKFDRENFTFNLVGKN